MKGHDAGSRGSGVVRAHPIAVSMPTPPALIHGMRPTFGSDPQQVPRLSAGICLPSLRVTKNPGGWAAFAWPNPKARAATTARVDMVEHLRFLA